MSYFIHSSCDRETIWRPWRWDSLESSHGEFFCYRYGVFVEVFFLLLSVHSNQIFKILRMLLSQILNTESTETSLIT